MIELSQIVCFLTIVDENSFSRAAERLGLAQSAVSQKLRRLEDQVGFQLIERTSRSVRLSALGLEFLPYARRLSEAEVSARNAARQLVEHERNTLRLGGYSFLSEERLSLMERFMAAAPQARLDVVHGHKAEMLSKLREGEIEAFICLAPAGAPLFEFEHIFLRRVTATIVLPAGHPLFERKVLRLEDLSGRQLAISPGRQDAPVLNQVCDHLTAKGIELIPAPEADRRSILSFARFRGLPSLRWVQIGSIASRIEDDGDAVVPLAHDPLVLDHYLYTRRGPQSEPLRHFRRLVTDFVDEERRSAA
jgi:DNA-binding transcriptional LysR family regulator